MRLPYLAIIILFTLAIALDWYNYRQFLHLRRKNGRKWPLVVYVTSIIVGLILLIGAVIYPKKNESDSVLPAMWMIYSWASLYAVKLMIAVFSILGKIPLIFHRKEINLGLVAGLPLGLLLCGMMWWGALVTVRTIDIRTVEIESDRIPKSFDGFRIVQFSDVHTGTWGDDTTFIAKLVDSINVLKPDLVVFTGDVVNRQSSEIKPFVSVFNRIKAKNGVYTILGNHDYGDYITWPDPESKAKNLDDLKSSFKDANWRLLDNEHTYIAVGTDSIALVGVGNWGEPPFHQYGDLNKALTVKDTVNAVSPRHYSILLSHNPEHWNRVVSNETGLDLTLSGHTHAMQFTLSFFGKDWSPAKWRYEHWGGLYERKDKNGKPVRIYVNTGAGEVGIPARIGALPELTLIILRHIP